MSEENHRIWGEIDRQRLRWKIKKKTWKRVFITKNS